MVETVHGAGDGQNASGAGVNQLIDGWKEHRAAPRFTLLIHAAKLICSAGEFLCIVRNVSASGVSVRTFHPLPKGEHMILELPNGDQHPVDRVWEREGSIGFRFLVDIDVDRLIENKSRFPKRAVRLKLQLPALVCCHGLMAGVVVHNISQQGAQIESPLYMAIDQKLRLEADNLPLIHAKVRWCSGENYGLVFDDTFQFDELAQLAAHLQGSCQVECGTYIPNPSD